MSMRSSRSQPFSASPKVFPMNKKGKAVPCKAKNGNGLVVRIIAPTLVCALLIALFSMQAALLVANSTDIPVETYHRATMGPPPPVEIRKITVRFGNDRNHQGPPADLAIHGNRTKYAPVPETHRRKFYFPENYVNVIAAFVERGWTRVESAKEAHFVYRSQNDGITNYFNTLEPWQRYSRVGGTTGMAVRYMDSKDGFVWSFRWHKIMHPGTSLYFLPETFSLKDEPERQAFQQRVLAGGMSRPWVLKKVSENNGVGVEMMGPSSPALQTAVSRVQADNSSSYIVQEYICNELVWSGGQKFDLRMFFSVASVDPPVVLYHDGYARVAGAAYSETDFSDTKKHLTNLEFRAKVPVNSTKEHFWALVRKHYDENRSELSKLIQIDPVEHVRNQLKEAIGIVALTFFELPYEVDPDNVRIENMFAFYGVDFVIDNDLDVWIIEITLSPGFGEDMDSRQPEWMAPLIDTVEEINMKQEADGQANILPLQKLGGWEVVYAGYDDWQYTYDGYKRSPNKKSCSGDPQTSQTGP